MGRARTWTDEQLAEAVKDASSWADVVRRLGLSPRGKSTGRFRGHAARLGLDVSHLTSKGDARPIDSPESLADEAVRESVTSSTSWAEALRKLGLSPSSWNHRRVQRIASSLSCELQQHGDPDALPHPPRLREEGQPSTNEKGARTEGTLLAALLRAGYNVLLPFGVARYDLVIESAKGFHRVQCKTARKIGGAISFSVSNSPPSGKRRPYGDEVDYFGVHEPSTGQTFLVPREAVAGCKWTATMRIEPPENGQEAGVRSAEPYRLM